MKNWSIGISRLSMMGARHDIMQCFVPSFKQDAGPRSKSPNGSRLHHSAVRYPNRDSHARIRADNLAGTPVRFPVTARHSVPPVSPADASHIDLAICCLCADCTVRKQRPHWPNLCDRPSSVAPHGQRSDQTPNALCAPQYWQLNLSLRNTLKRVKAGLRVCGTYSFNAITDGRFISMLGDDMR